MVLEDLHKKRWITGKVMNHDQTMGNDICVVQLNRHYVNRNQRL